MQNACRVDIRIRAETWRLLGAYTYPMPDEEFRAVVNVEVQFAMCIFRHSPILGDESGTVSILYPTSVLLEWLVLDSI